jgi:hypothetical protein
MEDTVLKDELNSEPEKLDSAVAEANVETVRSITIVTSAGAEVRAKQIPDNLMRTLWKQYPEPKPPVVTIERGGKKWTEPNVDDPAYAEAQKEHLLSMGEAIFNITLLKATEIVRYPEDVKPFAEDEDWIEEAEAMGFMIPTGRTGRYLLWMRMRIFPQLRDIESLQEACAKLSGISQEEIDSAVDRFRN